MTSFKHKYLPNSARDTLILKIDRDSEIQLELAVLCVTWQPCLPASPSLQGVELGWYGTGWRPL